MSWLTYDQYPTALDNLTLLRANGRQFCWRFNLAQTHEGRQIVGLRIHGSTRPEGESRGVLVVGGAHAREMVPPEAVLCFAVLLCQAYVAGTGLTFGGKTYSNGIVNLLVEVLDLYVVPLLNVDGRRWVEVSDQNWRKNRRPGTCPGVDLNRNHDFLFDSGIGTSSNPCDYQIYRGPSAHSEPESRGIRDFLSVKPHIKGALDMHSYAGLVLYPWGDDQSQTSDPSMAFTNPAYDGQRGVANDAYREYIASGDQTFYAQTAVRMRDRIREVANRTYVAEPSYGLYPTTGTLDDYGYARHLTSSSSSKVMSMTVELGTTNEGFRPAESIAQQGRMEGAVAIVEFCLAIMCAGDAVLSSGTMRSSASEMRAFRARLEEHTGGQRHLHALRAHGGELAIRLADPEVARGAASLIDVAIAWSRGERELDAATVRDGAKLLGALGKGASKELRAALDAARVDLSKIAGQPIDAALAMLVGGRPAPKKPPAKKKPARRR